MATVNNFLTLSIVKEQFRLCGSHQKADIYPCQMSDEMKQSIANRMEMF